MFLKLTNKMLSIFNLRIINVNKNILPIDLEDDFKQIYEQYKPFTMTSPERMYCALKAIDYIEQNNIQGDIVECGVWRGGSAMIMAKRLSNYSANRNFFLYDTYEGMTEPSEQDIEITGRTAKSFWLKNRDGNKNKWCLASLEEVQNNMKLSGYPEDKFSFIKGKVEDTIPNHMPNQIAILRLDTDWFESTYHELVNLYPLLTPGGILIIDDYGHWQGSKKAVDLYFKEQGIYPFMNRIDYSGRLIIKK